MIGKYESMSVTKRW